MTVRTVKRRGERRLVIDIPYTSPSGEKLRFRRDAEVQMMAAAKAEERRRLALLAQTGRPFEAGDDAPVELLELGVRPTTSRRASITVSAAVKEYFPSYGVTRLKPSTRRGYEAVFKSFVEPRVGDLQLDQLDATVMRSLDADLVKRRLAASTRRQMQSFVRSLARWAVEAGHLDEMPTFPKLPKTGATISKTLTTDEVARILANVEPRYLTILYLAVYAGLRAGEVRGLKWRDVDLERGILIVRRSRCRGVEAPPKSGHERVVPLHPKLADLLRAQPSKRSEHYVTGPEAGEAWPEHRPYGAFRSACAKAGITGFRFHDLRHAFVTGLFKRGASAPVVQRLAGHEHLSTTQRYAHAQLPDLVDAVSRIDW